MRNSVFLYDVKQLRDANQTRADLFRFDLKQFLGLQIDLEPITTSSSNNSSSQDEAIDICDTKLRFVRKELMKNAVQASKWIRNYFLKSPDVTVSSPVYFNELVTSWMTDPCTMR
jgi:hypothetical protein